MSHKELAKMLQEWFSGVSGLPGWVREHSPVWRVLRDNLRVLGNWKARPRGNPKKGYRVMAERKNE